MKNTTEERGPAMIPVVASSGKADRIRHLEEFTILYNLKTCEK
jgi:hypothetical protein